MTNGQASNQKQPRTVVVTGGGTSGHVYPVLQVIEALHSLDRTLQFAYIGQSNGAETTILRTQPLPVAVPFTGITTDKLRRYWDWRTILLPGALLVGIGQALQLLWRIMPSVVFAKGGYVSVPVAIAAWLLRIPIVLHETDAVMGLANRLIAPVASRIAVSFPQGDLPANGHRRGKAAYTGQPVSSTFYLYASAQRAKPRPQLLVTGGSQGSAPINSLVLGALPTLLERYSVTHLTGLSDFGRVRAAFNHRHYHPIAQLQSSEEMTQALAEADLIISRAGGTIFELAALGKPAILIPLPNAGNNHQQANAEILARSEAAVVLDQDKTTPQQLEAQIAELIADSRRRARLGANIRRFARPDAAAQVARLILEVAKR